MISDPTSDEERVLLQRRLALFALVLFCGHAFGLVGDVINVASKGELHPLQIFVWIAGLATGGLWLVMRTGQRSVVFSRRVDEAAIAVSAVTVCVNAPVVESYVYPVLQGDEPLTAANARAFGTAVHAYVLMGLTLGLTFAVMLRAALIPSSPVRTAMLTGIAGLPLVLAAPLGMLEIMSPIGLGSISSERMQAATSVAIWWGLTTVVSTISSWVIYGLRAEVDRVRQLGQYTLDRKIGQGGMGIVYAAQHALLRRPTAIKLINPAVAGEHAVSRFEREVKLTARLSHPHTVTIYDFGRTPDGIFYYAMELLDGATLEQIVEVGGPMSAPRVAHVLGGVSLALHEAHGIGLIHRDIKPANIFLAWQGSEADYPKVLDFGLVKDIEAKEGELTADQTVMGTPLYMAPEIVTGTSEVDGRGDIYALGAVAYYLLTGNHVFEGKTTVEVLSHHIHSAPVPPSERVGGVPDDLEAVVLQCLAKDPMDRPATADVVLQRVMACAAFGQWTRHDAREWWRRHSDALRASQRQSTPVGTRTIAVDLAGHRR